MTCQDNPIIYKYIVYREMSSLYAYRTKKDEIKTKQANTIRFMYIHTQTVEISCIHLFYTLHLLTDNCKH